MSTLAREALQATARESAFPTVCPACGMGVDDLSLERCPLCFYDLGAPPPETSETVISESSTLATTAHLSTLSGLDILMALLPLLVLLVILFLAVSEK